MQYFVVFYYFFRMVLDTVLKEQHSQVSESCWRTILTLRHQLLSEHKQC